MNNLNIFRPDSTYTSPRKTDKNLSRSKYQISRASVHDLTLSKKQLTIPEKEKTSSFFRKSNQLCRDEYGLDTFGQNNLEKSNHAKRSSALQLLRSSQSKKSINLREKSLTRFRTEPCIEE